MGAVIDLHPTAKQRQQRQPTRCKVVTKAAKLAVLRKQSKKAADARDASLCGDTLRMLAYLARCAAPRARSIYWDGIRFPLRQGFAINTVLCPLTGQPLIGAMAL